MTIAAELETMIARTPEAVFAELTAIERFPEWLTASGVREVERLDEGPVEEGSRVRIEQRVAGRTTTLDGLVTVFEPGQRFALRATDQQGIVVELDATISGDGAASRLGWAIRISLPLRFRFFESMVAPELRRAAQTDLQNLKSRLEAVAG